MQAQSHLHTYYEELASRRGNHARRSSGDNSVKYAEAFQRVTPQVVDEL
jgi:4-oxalomesaconate hydratase